MTKMTKIAFEGYDYIDSNENPRYIVSNLGTSTSPPTMIVIDHSNTFKFDWSSVVTDSNTIIASMRKPTVIDYDEDDEDCI